jgi:hypothetical protein
MSTNSCGIDRVIFRKSTGNCDIVVGANVYDIAALKLALNRQGASGQQAAAVFQRPNRTIVDADAALDR